MVIIRGLMAIVIFLLMVDEMIREEYLGIDREGLIKVGLMMVFEMWLLGG